jgi:hypothetical protein
MLSFVCERVLVLENFCSYFKMGCFFVYYIRIFIIKALSLSLHQSLSSRIHTHAHAQTRALSHVSGRILFSLFIFCNAFSLLSTYILFVCRPFLFSRIFSTRSLFLSRTPLVRESFTYQSAPGFRQSSRTPSPKCLPSPKFARKTSRRASGTRPRPSACARCLP